MVGPRKGQDRAGRRRAGGAGRAWDWAEFFSSTEQMGALPGYLAGENYSQRRSALRWRWPCRIAVTSPEVRQRHLARRERAQS